MKSNTYADFQFLEDEAGKHAIGHGLAITVEGGGKTFHRRCIKKHMADGSTSEDSILVCELDGVRVYVKPPGHIIVTKRNLRL